MPKPSEYRAIALWGRQLGSFKYYIDNEQAKAARMNAPVDALFEREGKWVCVSDLHEGHDFRTAYNAMLQKDAGGTPMRAKAPGMLQDSVTGEITGFAPKGE